MLPQEGSGVGTVIGPAGFRVGVPAKEIRVLNFFYWFA